MRSVVLDISWALSLVYKSYMSSLSAAFALGDIWVHIHILYSGDITFYIEVSVNTKELLCISQILTYTMAMSDLGKILIIWGLDVMHTLLKIWVDLIIDLTMLELMEMFISSMM